MRLERDGPVALVRLERAERANAITPDLFAALGRALEEATGDEAISVIVLTGSGAHFCAGADIQRGLTLRDDGAAPATERSPNPFLVLRRAEIPVIAAVEGAAVGIGLGLALATDVVVAGRSARFEAPQVGFGLVPDGGLAFSLPRVVGRQLARAMALCGAVLDGTEAHQHGLVAMVVDDGAALGAGLELARSAARAPRDALRRAKAVLDAGDVDMAATVDAERQMLAEGFRDPFFLRAVEEARLRTVRPRSAGG